MTLDRPLGEALADETDDLFATFDFTEEAADRGFGLERSDFPESVDDALSLPAGVESTDFGLDFDFGDRKAKSERRLKPASSCFCLTTSEEALALLETAGRGMVNAGASVWLGAG